MPASWWRLSGVRFRRAFGFAPLASSTLDEIDAVELIR